MGRASGQQQRVSSSLREGATAGGSATDFGLRRAFMPRQDATNDQAESVFERAQLLGLNEIAVAGAELFQGVPGARVLTDEERAQLHTIAVEIGCYDADDLFCKLL